KSYIISSHWASASTHKLPTFTSSTTIERVSMTTTTSVSRRERRKVLAATTIGTASEWYDYFLYAAVAGLVFNKVMFGPLEGGLASIIAFLTVGISFLFRPLGAFLAGHYGDRVGRRFVLMVTPFAMGGATTLLGLLPTYDTLGYFAPLLLILLRIIQCISAGGEWGCATTRCGRLPSYGTFGYFAPLLLILLRIIQGSCAGGEWGSAVLLAVEHAPKEKRGMFGAGAQIGVRIGLLLSSAVLSIMNWV